MSTPHAQKVYNLVRRDIMSVGNAEAIWNEDCEHQGIFFVVIVQDYTDRTATTLIANATVAYLARIVLLSFRNAFRRFSLTTGILFSGYYLWQPHPRQTKSAILSRNVRIIHLWIKTSFLSSMVMLQRLRGMHMISNCKSCPWRGKIYWAFYIIVPWQGRSASGSLKVDVPQRTFMIWLWYYCK